MSKLIFNRVIVHFHNLVAIFGPKDACIDHYGSG